MSGLVDMTGRPISTARMVPGPSRDTGSFRDPISGWHGPQIHSPQAAARELWCNASWIGPARGFVDPVKEIQAVVMALNHNLMTYGEAWGERGGDWDEGSATILHEAPTLRRIVEAKPAPNPVTATGKNGIAPESAADDEEEKS